MLKERQSNEQAQDNRTILSCLVASLCSSRLPHAWCWRRLDNFSCLDGDQIEKALAFALRPVLLLLETCPLVHQPYRATALLDCPGQGYARLLIYQPVTALAKLESLNKCALRLCYDWSDKSLCRTKIAGIEKTVQEAYLGVSRNTLEVPWRTCEKRLSAHAFCQQTKS